MVRFDYVYMCGCVVVVAGLCVWVCGFGFWFGGAACSPLEARAPLLDTEVATFCLALPESLRLRGTTTKYLLRRALGNRVPRSILERPKKGFGAPIGRWLRGPLRELLLDTLSPARMRLGGWFEPAFVARHVDEHLSGARDHRKLLFALICVEHWRRRWLEAA